jgi:WD40 repeat protein
MRIWNVRQLVSQEALPDTPENPRQLAELHVVGASGIKCVRWSPSGQFLAAGADDGALTVWRMESGTPMFNGVTNFENWVLHFKINLHKLGTFISHWPPSQFPS